MSFTTTARAVIRHRKATWSELAALAGAQGKELDELRPRVTGLEAAADKATLDLDGALQLVTGLRIRAEDAERARDRDNAKATRYDEAEARATTAEQAFNNQTRELLALRAFRSNALAMSDLSVQQEQPPTAPAPTATRFNVGRAVQAGASPHAAHIPQPVVDNEATVEMPQVEAEVA